MMHEAVISAPLPGGAAAVRRQRLILLLVLTFALILRIYTCFFSHLPNLHRDSVEYMGQADAIINGSYINFFPNGYPFMIAAVKWLVPASSITVLLWLNIFMSTAIVWFVYKILLKLFNSYGLAVIAAIITALFPSQVNYVRWLISEVPTAFFLVGGFCCFYYDRRWLAGLLLGAAAVVRTEIIPIAILLFAAEWISRKRSDWRLLAGFIIPLLLTAGYCYSKTGQFSVSGHGEVNIVLAATASGSYIDWELADQHPEIRSSRQAISFYMDTFRSEPVSFLKRRALNFWELWGFLPSSGDGSRGVGSRLLIGAGNLFLLCFGFYAAWKNWGRAAVNMLLLPFIVITAVHIVFFAMQRYTYPVEPFMIILSSWTVAAIFPRLTLWIGGERSDAVNR